MHDCPECGKHMATAGGLEIHIELAHAAPAPPPPVAVPTVAAVGVPAAAPLPTRTSAPASRTEPLRMPAFIRRFDSTVLVTALLVVGMLVAGVGAALGRGSESQPIAAEARSGAVAPPLGSAAPTVDTAADQRLAQSLVLDQTDLPSGWAVQPHATDPDEAQAERDEAACLGLADPAATKSAETYGVEASQNQLFMTTAVLVTRTAQQASAYESAQAGPKSAGCAKQGLIKAFAGDGMVVNDVGMGRFTASTGEVRSVAMHAEIAVSQDGHAGVVFADVVFMQQGRATAQALFVSIGSPFPPDVESTVITRFAHKVARA